MYGEQAEIPPVREVGQEPAKFAERVPIWGLTVFTVDGYIIAHHAFPEKIPPKC